MGERGDYATALPPLLLAQSHLTGRIHPIAAGFTMHPTRPRSCGVDQGAKKQYAKAVGDEEELERLQAEDEVRDPEVHGSFIQIFIQTSPFPNPRLRPRDARER